MKNVFDYKCHFQLLKDLYEEKHKDSYKFSHGFISDKLGYNSRSGFNHILKGNKKLSEKDIKTLAELFELYGKDYEYFRLLIKYNQAGSIDEKVVAKKQLLELNPIKESYIKEHDHHFYSNWLNTAIRNILSISNFTIKQITDITGLFITKVNEEDIQDAIKYLLDNEFISIDSEGFLNANDKFLRTKTSFGTKELDEYHRKMIRLSIQNMHKIPARYKEYSSLNFSFPKEKLDYVIDQLKLCRQSILDIVENEKSCDTVFHLNMQLFPITKVMED